MSVNYLCPSCKKSVYNPETAKLTLKGKLTGNFFTVEELFELNHQKDSFGGKILSNIVKMDNGAHVDFICPHCGFDLTTDFDKELSELKYIDEEGTENSFIISKIMGKEMAFIICKDKKEILKSYGKDHADYLQQFYEYFNMWGKF